MISVLSTFFSGVNANDLFTSTYDQDVIHKRRIFSSERRAGACVVEEEEVFKVV